MCPEGVINSSRAFHGPAQLSRVGSGRFGSGPVGPGLSDPTREVTQHFHPTRPDLTRPDPTPPDRSRHDTTRHDTTRHDTTRHDTTRHDTTQHDRRGFEHLLTRRATPWLMVNKKLPAPTFFGDKLHKICLEYFFVCTSSRRVRVASVLLEDSTLPPPEYTCAKGMHGQWLNNVLCSLQR